MRIVRVNSRHSQAQPVYGPDLVQAVSIVKDVWSLVKHSEYLTNMLKTPVDRVTEMKDVFSR